MSDGRIALGAFGERYARTHLQKAGYRIVEVNARLPSGEIDIVAEEGGVLALVEVRTKRGDRFGNPEESITEAKAEKLIDLGHEYAEAHPEWADRWRIDVVAVEVDRRGRVSRIEVHRNAVDGG